MIKIFKIFESLQDVKACVVCVENEKGEILLLKRSVKCKLQGWCFPGGRIENVEEFEIAAIREVMEETGIILDTDDIQYMGNLPSVKGYMVAIFYARLNYTPNVIISEEHDDFEWSKNPYDYDLAGNTGQYIDKVKMR